MRIIRAEPTDNYVEVPPNLMINNQISDGAKVLYMAYLAIISDGKPTTDKAAADYLELTLVTVRKRKKELELAGLVHRKNKTIGLD